MRTGGGLTTIHRAIGSFRSWSGFTAVLGRFRQEGSPIIDRLVDRLPWMVLIVEDVLFGGDGSVKQTLALRVSDLEGAIETELVSASRTSPCLTSAWLA